MGARGDQQLVEVDRRAALQFQGVGVGVYRGRPALDYLDTLVGIMGVRLAQVGAGLIDVIDEVVRQRHARVRRFRFVADQLDRTGGIGLPERFRCDDAGGPGAYDDVLHVVSLVQVL